MSRPGGGRPGSLRRAPGLAQTRAPTWLAILTFNVPNCSKLHSSAVSNFGMNVPLYLHMWAGFEIETKYFEDSLAPNHSFGISTTGSSHMCMQALELCST